MNEIEVNARPFFFIDVDNLGLEKREALSIWFLPDSLASKPPLCLRFRQLGRGGSYCL